MYSSGTAAMASAALSGEEEVLDLGGLLLPAVADEEIVVEVLRLGTHPTDVEADQAPSGHAGLGDVRARTERHAPLAMISNGALAGIAFSEAGSERVAPHLLETVGHEVDRLPDVGHLAVSSTFFGPIVASAIGMSLAGGRFMNRIGLPNPVPPSASGRL